MKVSRNWLQNYFEQPLPEAEAIGDALTSHSFEMEEIQGDLLDINVLPDRAAYALCHRGIALEIAAALNIPLKEDPLRTPLPEFPKSDELEVVIENPEKCLRYMGALVRGVKVGPSPEWLKAALESVGQRSINNVVDATNYVMLNIGQPLHAFDAGKLSRKADAGAYAIKVRGAFEGEKITTLTGEEYVLPEDTLLITDASTDGPALGIAGIKGGDAAKVTDATTDLIIESANFDGSTVRRAAQALKLFTDASLRFQNKPSPELAAYGMRDVIALILQVAGGELVGVVDEYPTKLENAPVSVSLGQINAVLGTAYDADQPLEAMRRLGLPYRVETPSEGDITYVVTPPFERRDIVIPEDLIEEVGRILGYEYLPSLALLPDGAAPDQARFRGIERVKDFLIEQGWTEVSTQTFAPIGDVLLANPLDMTKPYLRTTLAGNMQEVLTRAVQVVPRVLGPAQVLKLFEVGTVFKGGNESLELALGYQQLIGKPSAQVLPEICQLLGDAFMLHTSVVSGEVVISDLSSIDLAALGKLTTGEHYQPRAISMGTFKPFSPYPFALRDIAVWTPAGTEESEVSLLIEKEAGVLLVRIDLFDRFQKEVNGVEKISYAFRLVFQSDERTLSDADFDPAMERITNTLNAKEGWQVR